MRSRRILLPRLRWSREERPSSLPEPPLKVSFQQYIAGKASYFEVRDSQLQLYPAENALAVTELNRRAVIVPLYKALGGGWNLKDPEWVGPRC